jgi:predicted porin
MNKSIVVCCVLGTFATLASAQDRSGAPLPASEPELEVSEPAGGHDIAVFTAQPVLEHGADWHVLPKTSRIRPDEFRPGTGVGGFTLGRQYNLEYLTRPDVGDVRSRAMGGRDAGPVLAGAQGDGAVRYYNSRAHGVSAGSSWIEDGSAVSPQRDRAWGMSVGVDYGPWSLRGAHQSRRVARVRMFDTISPTMDVRNSIIAANLRMGWGTAYAAYSTNRGWGGSPLYNPDNPYGAGVASTTSTDSRDTLAGLAVPMSRSTTFLASFIHKNDRNLANRDANQIAIGASHVVSRKTDFYAALSRTVVTSGAGILINSAAHPSGSSAINVGMRHAF